MTKSIIRKNREIVSTNLSCTLLALPQGKRLPFSVRFWVNIWLEFGTNVWVRARNLAVIFG
jgi:hypothetical protein